MRLLALALFALALPASALAAAGFYGDRTLPVRGGDTTVSRIEPRFSAVATSIAGKKTEVRCWSKGDWARLNEDEISHGERSLDYVGGFYVTGGIRIHLEPSICAGLVALTYRRHMPSSGREFRSIVMGVDTLAHESTHRRGYVSESVTECYAVQLVDRTARQLGAGSSYAHILAVSAWKDLYAAHPPVYRTPDCHDGGPLDLNPRTASWP